MRTLVLMLAALFVPAAAFAFHGNLTTGACPGDPLAASAASLDCASGGSFAVYGTFRPDIAIPDLVGLDARLRLTLQGPTFDTAPFWNFDDASSCSRDPNTAAPVLSVDRLRPASGCAAWLDTWNDPSGGSGILASQTGSNSLRIALLCYRPTPGVSVVPGDDLFGFQLVMDLANATEAGQSCAGCASQVLLEWTSAAAHSASGNTDDVYSEACYHSDCPPPITQFSINPQVVPTTRHTWGQLKALYRR